MLTVVLAEAEVELVPIEVCRHPAIIAHARQRGKRPEQILLDSNYHHAVMSTLPEGRQRGRPDITHLFLLTSLESIVNKQGRLRVIVHTRDDNVIMINPETRIMRNYERFLGLIEQLFDKQIVPDEKHPLLSLRPHMNLKHIVEEQHADTVVALSKSGTSVELQDYFKELHRQKKYHVLCIIGGFPSGGYHADINTIVNDVISIYSEMLPVWTVVNELLVNYRNMCR